MASPQLENGFLQIARELIEPLAHLNLSSYEWRFVWALWSKTWCFHKKEDFIPTSQIAEITGLHKAHVSRAKKTLIERRIVTDGCNSCLKFNKNYDEWQKLPMGATAHSCRLGQPPVTDGGTPVTDGGTGVTNGGYSSLPPLADSKEKKETFSKEASSKESPKEKTDAIPYAEILADLNLKAGTKYRLTPKIRELIRPRWSEGFRLDDFKTVHSKKCGDWLGTDNAKWIRPETLYGTKFQGYLNQLQQETGFSKVTQHNIKVIESMMQKMETENGPEK
jgi:phage replication O-like protein O